VCIKTKYYKWTFDLKLKVLCSNICNSEFTNKFEKHALASCVTYLAWLQASTAVYVIFSFFWDVTQRGSVVSNRRFGQPIGPVSRSRAVPRVKRSKHFKNWLILEDGINRLSRNVGNDQYTLLTFHKSEDLWRICWLYSAYKVWSWINGNVQLCKRRSYSVLAMNILFNPLVGASLKMSVSFPLLFVPPWRDRDTFCGYFCVIY
jgi:hypothetical protein